MGPLHCEENKRKSTVMSEKEINKWKYSTYNALKQKMGTMNNVAQKPMNEM